ncbi:TPA: hypothetical protein RQJ98_004282 [Vibrio vulnificus]|nr:hypothetical protein [Vibrio vulnificus]HDY7544656.1 hypothetical protein [Vibrio vulnificus]HDY7685657.1 hypothetical protein [Vibrio vulnificus]
MSADKLILSSGSEQLLLSISPDWPSILVTGLIGLGSILTSIAVVKISRRNQKSQSNEKVAELRQQWLVDLRNSLSKFISIASILSVRSKVEKNYHASDEATAHYQELFFYKTKILLMLDDKKDYTLILKSLINDVAATTLKKDQESVKDIGNLSRALEEQAQKVLEKAWLDIKKDLAA